MASFLVPIVLAGGKGERFWPLSRRQRPKQFLCLDGSDRSLFQATGDRLAALIGDWSVLWTITGSHLADGIRAQLPEMPAENLLVEPEGRDTAPAVAWATLEVARRYGDEAVLGFFPADHWIPDKAAFETALKAAASLARDRAAIATLGIAPTTPATGYGYIEQGEPVGDYEGLAAYRVSRFTEKPDRPTAETFLASGRYSWNSGMFVFQAKTMLAELAAHAPEILEPLKAKGRDAYGELPKLSVDYAVMEKTERACVLPVSFPWDDLGDWNAVERLLKGDRDNLVSGNHAGLDTHGAIVYSSDPDELVVTVGVEDLVIVRDGNATLIVPKSRTQDIKKAVKLLQDRPDADALL